MALLGSLTACDRTGAQGPHPYDDPARAAANQEVRTDAEPVVVLANAGEVVKDGPDATTLQGKGAPEPAGRWDLVQATDGPTALYDFERGVLVNVGGAHFTVSHGKLSRADAAGLPEDGGPIWAEADVQHVEGSFPDDAWIAEISHYDRAGASLTLRKYVPEGEAKRSGWVAQRMKAPKVGYFDVDGRQLEADDTFMLRKSGQAGYLVAGWDEAKIGFARIGGGRGAPRAMDIPPAFFGEHDAYPADFFQDATGRIHVLGHSYETEGTVVLTSARCKRSEPKCEGTLTSLPSAPHGNVAQVVARSDRAFTAAVNDSWMDEAWASHLIHHDGSAWAVELAPGKGHVRAMVAANDGGLWAVVESAKVEDGDADAKRGQGAAQLWHRDADGEWSLAELPSQLGPRGAEGLDVAVDERDQLWLAVNGEGRHALFVTPASDDSMA